MSKTPDHGDTVPGRRELDGGSTMRLAVESISGEQTIVYVANDDGDVLVNDATDSEDSWEVDIEQTNELRFDIYGSAEAHVTIEVASG